VTHLVSCSCTGFHAPGVDIALVKALGLPPTVSRTHIGFMGCHGAFNALAIARQAVEADPDATVLVVAVELCSLHFSYGFDPQQVVANALFADGAGAAIVADQHSEANGKPRPRLAASASRLFDASDDAMTWTIGDHGFRMTLAATVPGLVEAQLRPWLEPWLDEHDLAIDAVGGWAIHPGGPRVIQAVANALDLHENATAISRAVLREAGNMSSATVLFILQRMLRDDRTQRPIVALGFGPGLVGEAMLLR
jgi:predicted naringenin-chalcone synthase